MGDWLAKIERIFRKLQDNMKQINEKLDSMNGQFTQAKGREGETTDPIRET